MKLKLNVWRQPNGSAPGRFIGYAANEVSKDMSFLEMLDVLNEELMGRGEDPIAFDHDCREGICGSCSMVINGRPHGPQKHTTACQLHMRQILARGNHHRALAREGFWGDQGPDRRSKRV